VRDDGRRVFEVARFEMTNYLMGEATLGLTSDFLICTPSNRTPIPEYRSGPSSLKVPRAVAVAPCRLDAR
jgi:hypothetical protein